MAEFPPTGWEIYEDKDFASAVPHRTGEAVMELMAQVRPSGRCADHWRIAVGGNKILEADIRLTAISKLTGVSPFKLRFQAWPKDVKLRRNMTSSKWYDGLELLSQREFVVYKDGTDGELKPDELLNIIAKEEDVAKKAFSIRFGVAITEDKRIRLELQGLPATETYLASKPAFAG